MLKKATVFDQDHTQLGDIQSSWVVLFELHCIVCICVCACTYESDLYNIAIYMYSYKHAECICPYDRYVANIYMCAVYIPYVDRTLGYQVFSIPI